MRAKILIVDDESAIRQMVCLALSQANYGCLEAADTAEAQARILADKPDLILLDWMLPGLSGVEYSRRLRREKLTRDIPIILLTARSFDEDIQAVMDLGGITYMGKPFEFALLLQKLWASVGLEQPVASAARVISGASQR